ncbi:hypothetical protein F511_03605 [Dorcoceras hygrometricum]|uniref:Uncharacterized protein n=1 Tax=Dorcoceras hygrometricum TaxID=472368 RepID=A0A2Z7D5D0_9LAMI|nr:hypothetical protein F511_03605 [Dorcoceras hygrometricum]
MQTSHCPRCWVTRKWHKNHVPSLSDVTATFSSSTPCQFIPSSKALRFYWIRGSNDHDVAAPSQHEDKLKSLQSNMLSFKSIVKDKRARSPVITTGGMTASPEMAERTEETPSTDSPDGFDLAAFVAPSLEQRMKIIIQKSWARTELEIEHLSNGEKKRGFITTYQRGWFLEIVDSNGKQLINLIMPLARMMPHILMAMGVQTNTATRWNIVRPTQFPKQSLSSCLRLVTVACDWFCLRLVTVACDWLLLLATGFACDRFLSPTDGRERIRLISKRIETAPAVRHAPPLTNGQQPDPNAHNRKARALLKGKISAGICCCCKASNKARKS